MSRSVAVGGLRQQAFGLALIIVGTLCQAISQLIQFAA
jgi:hypothetical protein